jgi:putative nucleotidyltransferase with HDIG domain
LGRQRLRDLVVSTAYAKVIPSRLPGYEIEGRQFWAHCAAVGTYAEALGRYLGTQHTSELFTAGLLHDCGKLIGLDTDEQGGSAAGPMSVDPSRVSASAVRGAKHAKAGEFLAKAWDLPPLLVAAAKYHHAPTRLPHGRARLAASIVHVANATAHAMGFGSTATPKVEELDDQVVEDLGIDSKVMRPIAATSLEHLERLIGVFDGR